MGSCPPPCSLLRGFVSRLRRSTVWLFCPVSGGHSKNAWREGGSDVFLWVENLHARDHSRICLGLKRIREFFSVFGSYLRANFSFRVFVAISGSEKYWFELFFSATCWFFFGLEILMSGIFLGLKFQACVFFWVCNMKHCRTPRHVYFEYPPGQLSRCDSDQLERQSYFG